MDTFSECVLLENVWVMYYESTFLKCNKICVYGKLFIKMFFVHTGIVFSDGKHWEKQRKFSLQKLKNFGMGRTEMETKIEEESRELVGLFKTKCSQPILIHNTFDISAINVLWAMMAGERFTLEDSRLTKLFNIIHAAFQTVDISGGILNHMPFLRYVAPDACGYNKLVDTLKQLWGFIEVDLQIPFNYLCYFFCFILRIPYRNIEKRCVPPMLETL